MKYSTFFSGDVTVSIFKIIVFRRGAVLGYSTLGLCTQRCVLISAFLSGELHSQ